MRRTIAVLAFLLGLACTARLAGRALAGPTLPAGFGSLTLEAVESGGLDRYFWVYEPDGVGADAPVVVCFHGGGGNAKSAINGYGIVEEAEARGWIAVFPQGTGPLGGPPFFALETWNGGACCGSAQENDVDDVGFFADMINALASDYPIDRTCVFATGMSNGAIMSYRIAIERPDLVRAIAPVAGARMTQGLDAPLPTCPVPVLAIHGLLDENVPFEGGPGVGVSSADFTSQPDSVLPFLAVNGGAFAPAPFGAGEALLFVSEPTDASAPFADTWYFLALDGGHTWPGSLGSPLQPDEPVHTAVPATPLVFDFFALQ